MSRNTNTAFNVGDVIQKKHGKRTAVVEDINEDWMYVRWEHTGNRHFVSLLYGKADRWKLAEEESAMAELYEIMIGDQKKVATKLMEKSNKCWIMEVKGSGEVVTADPKDIKEILPYTILVNMNGVEATYRADEDKYKVGDVFIMGKTLQLARVLKLDTKDKKARGDFKPFAKVVIDPDI